MQCIAGSQTAVDPAADELLDGGSRAPILARCTESQHPSPLRARNVEAHRRHRKTVRMSAISIRRGPKHPISDSSATPACPVKHQPPHGRRATPSWETRRRRRMEVDCEIDAAICSWPRALCRRLFGDALVTDRLRSRDRHVQCTAAPVGSRRAGLFTSNASVADPRVRISARESRG